MVIAEAIAAGKVVITDPQTAATFSGAVIAAQPGDVDQIIAGFIANPSGYRQQVERAQSGLADHSAAAFSVLMTDLVHHPREVAA